MPFDVTPMSNVNGGFRHAASMRLDRLEPPCQIAPSLANEVYGVISWPG